MGGQATNVVRSVLRRVPRLESLLRRSMDIPVEATLPAADSVTTDSVAMVATPPEMESTATVAPSMPMLVAEGVSQQSVLRFCEQMAPFEVEGRNKIRLGNDHDGGYIFIDDFAEISTVISCGISTDVTCDVAFAEMGKPVLQFDHTVEGPPVSHPLFDFRKQAIDAVESIPGSVRLWDVVKDVGDPAKSDILLKIDIDGEEWTTFANYPVDDLKRFRQLSCEFHWSSRMTDPEYFSLCVRAIENLRKVFFPVHLHANNFVGFCNLMGVPLPEVYEVTFVNNAFYRPSHRQQGAPTAIDNPNNPDAPDLFLGSPFRIA